MMGVKKSVEKQNLHNDSNTRSKRVRNIVSILGNYTKNVVDDVIIIFRLPVLFALFAVNCIVIFPLGILSIILYGIVGVALLVVTQTPVMYLIVREARRQLRSLPMSESWELSGEAWDSAIEVYVEKIERIRGEKNAETSEH